MEARRSSVGVGSGGPAGVVPSVRRYVMPVIEPVLPVGSRSVSEPSPTSVVPSPVRGGSTGIYDALGDPIPSPMDNLEPVPMDLELPSTSDWDLDDLELPALESREEFSEHAMRPDDLLDSGW